MSPQAVMLRVMAVAYAVGTSLESRAKSCAQRVAVGLSVSTFRTHRANCARRWNNHPLRSLCTGAFPDYSLRRRLSRL